MASVHRHHKSPYWMCYFTLSDGRRTSRSTRQRDRKKAWAFCLKLEQASEKARAGELTETTARRIIDDILESTGARALPHDTVRAFAGRWLVAKAPGVTKSTASRYRQVITAFLESLGPLADRSLGCVNATHVAAYRDKRLQADRITRGTVGRDLAALSGLFISARRQGLILINPVEGVQLPVNQPLEREVFTPQELVALLGVAGPEWRTLILCGYFLAGRLIDMATLQWDAIDLVAGLISYTQGKTALRVVVPIHPQLEEHLLSIAGDQHGALCPTLSKVSADGRRGLSNQFAKLMRAAGIDRREICLGKNTVARKSYHGLRHSFVSALANAGVPSEVRMKLAGHKTTSIHQVYSHLELEPLRKAVKTLPRL